MARRGARNRRRWTACDLAASWRRSIDGMNGGTHRFACASRILGDVRLVDADGTPLGSRRGVIGTGFCVAVRGEAGDYPYLLTADHVLEEQENVQVEFPDATPGGHLHPPARATDWRRPLDDVDLAICPLSSIPHPPGNPRILALHIDEFAAPVALAAPVFYVGILDPLDRPMVRSGTIGGIDEEGIEHDGGYVYTAHLVDCRSYEGFSGSACFMQRTFALRDKTEEFPDVYKDRAAAIGPMAPLQSLYIPVGMFTEHLDDENPEGAASRYGVGVMLRDAEIKEALMSSDFLEERREWDRGAGKSGGEGPKLRAARKGVVPVTATEFERFEDFTRKLAQVPKSELDEKRKKDD